MFGVILDFHYERDFIMLLYVKDQRHLVLNANCGEFLFLSQMCWQKEQRHCLAGSCNNVVVCTDIFFVSIGTRRFTDCVR